MSPSPTILLIDNSNTRTKFTLAHGGTLSHPIRHLPTDQLTPERVRQLLADWTYDRAILCSVATRDKSRILREALNGPVDEVSSASAGSLLRLYEHPEKVGADRIANAAALAAEGLFPAVAVDLGTACTFDIVGLHDGRPALLGGTIAPGRELLARALGEHTALLPSIHLPLASTQEHEPSPIARDTSAAILAGVQHGYSGMLHAIWLEIVHALGCVPRAVITGGDSSMWTPPHATTSCVDKLLTFKGMLALHGEEVRVFLGRHAN